MNFEIYVFASLIPAKENGASADGFRRSGGLLQRSLPLQVEIYRPFLRPTAAATPQNTTEGTSVLQNECAAEGRRDRTFVS